MNNLESYCASVKRNLEKITNKVKELEDWTQENPNAKTEEYEAKQKELESIFNSIMQKASQTVGEKS